ncbi:MAG: transposase [Cryobacterium sp.]|nr:transposase [Cryobacterium sp.]
MWLWISPVAHVAKELGISRQCAHRWVRRYRESGAAGLVERSSRPPRSQPGPWREYSPATTSPPLAWCDLLTDELIRASRATANPYERDKPGELVHSDVKELGRIPDGGGWHAHGRSEAVRGRGIGFDDVHVVIDDHSRLAYAAVVLLRTAEFFRSCGIPEIERVISDNAFAYRISTDFKKAVTQLHALAEPLPH